MLQFGFRLISFFLSSSFRWFFFFCLSIISCCSSWIVYFPFLPGLSKHFDKNHLIQKLLSQRMNRVRCFFLSLQAPLICTPGYPKSTLPWPSHFLWGHLSSLFVPEQTACHLLQRQHGPEPRGCRRPAAERFWTQVRTNTTCYTCFSSVTVLKTS